MSCGGDGKRAASRKDSDDPERNKRQDENRELGERERHRVVENPSANHRPDGTHHCQDHRERSGDQVDAPSVSSRGRRDGEDPARSEEVRRAADDEKNECAHAGGV